MQVFPRFAVVPGTPSGDLGIDGSRGEDQAAIGLEPEKSDSPSGERGVWRKEERENLVQGPSNHSLPPPHMCRAGRRWENSGSPPSNHSLPPLHMCRGGEVLGEFGVAPSNHILRLPHRVVFGETHQL